MIYNAMVTISIGAVRIKRTSGVRTVAVEIGRFNFYTNVRYVETPYGARPMSLYKYPN